MVRRASAFSRCIFVLNVRIHLQHCLNNYVNYRRAVEKAPKLKPQRLIFFRGEHSAFVGGGLGLTKCCVTDGVSEGQFSQVIEQELTLLKSTHPSFPV